MGFYHFLGIYFSFFLVYLLTFFFVPLFCLFVCFCCTCVLGEFCSFVVVSYLLLLLTHLLCLALCFVLCFSLHLQNQFLSITLVPILIIPFSLSLSLSTFVSFFLLLLQKFVYYLSFCGKILAKFCFANF